MKNAIRKKTAAAAKAAQASFCSFLLAASLLFLACSGEPGGETGTISLSFGVSARAALWPSGSGVTATIGMLTHLVTLKKGSQTKTENFASGKTGGIISVEAGVWDVQVEAQYEGITLGLDETSVNVAAGATATATLKMEKIANLYLVKSLGEWEAAIDDINSSTGVSEYYIVVTGGFDFLSTSTLKALTASTGGTRTVTIRASKNTEGTYIARTDTEKSLSVEDVCRALKTRGGFTGSYEDLLDHIRQYYDEVSYQLCDGYAVSNGYYTVHSNIGGTFNTAAEIHDHKKHPITFRFSSRSKLRNLAKNIDVEVEGVADTGGYIDEYIDQEESFLNTQFSGTADRYLKTPRVITSSFVLDQA